MATCLMLAGDQHGRAEEAMTLYTSVFEDSQVLSVNRIRLGGGEEAEGTVRAARFVLAGRALLAMDSGQPHPFGFTPAMSLVVDFGRAQELDQVFDRLSEGATEFKELQEYPFSKRFGWLEDRFSAPPREMRPGPLDQIKRRVVDAHQYQGLQRVGRPRSARGQTVLQ